jgi:hypothetical protein
MAGNPLDALKFSLQALAQPADFQRGLLSAWGEGVAELGERFVQAERRLVRGEGRVFTRAQGEALAALHARFEAFCGPANAAHWREDALGWSPHWAAVRRAAGGCLEAFGWAAGQPPLDLQAYGDDYYEPGPA